MKKGFLKRLLAIALTLCTVVGLLPAVAVFEAEAATIAEETASLVSSLTTAYNSFTIPMNKEVYNYTTLDGVFFLGHGLNRTIDFSKTPVTHKDRLTAKTNNGEAAVNYSHLWSVPIDQTNGTKINTINGSTPNNLNYAVEIKTYTDTVTWNTTSSFTDDNDKTQKGWAAYAKFEYNRSNSWCGTSTYYGKYLGINGVTTTSDPKYSIKSLHPNRASAPYLACDNGDGEMRYKNTAFPFFFKVNDTNASVKIYKVAPKGENLYTYWLGVETNTSNSHNNCFTAHTMAQIVREDRNKKASTDSTYKNCNLKQFNFAGYNIYQVSPVPLELYRALEKAKTYVTGQNADGKYPAETYLGFLKFVQSAMATYNSKRTVWSTDKNHADRITCDAIAKDLTSYMALLDIEAKPGTYMDIPMEILDFRADGLMFEDWNKATPYSFSTDRPTVSAAPGSVSVFPGTNGTGEDGTSGYVAGLIESRLKNGQILYTEEAVTYIANALFWQYHTFSDPAASSSDDYRGDFAADDMDAYYNKVFMQMVDPNTGNRPQSNVSVDSLPVGSYDETIADTDTGENGGILLFSQVDTCFDLAYYMMTNIWRETGADDIVETVTKGSTTFNLPYNLKVSELHTMRLLKDSSGNYVYSSDKENGRNLDSGLIFNHSLTTNASTTLPTLNAVADLGFESSSMLGNNTTGGRENPSGDYYGKRNYHVMYHMKSSFIYYEDKNLNFSFTGDDDVYFFINNERVCEIGGMHGASKRSLDLNSTVADQLGLEDGDICTFDMFLAERHTSAINLNLTTNIEMMPVGAATDKVQYEYTQAGITGKEIKEGGVVADKTEVGYGFKLLNRCEHGATDLTFTDDNLSVSLTGDALSLGGRANAGDLILIYRTYDPQTNTLYAGEPVAQDYNSLYSQLTAAIADMSTVTPMTEGAYQLTGLTEEQIMALLKLGLPANVQIAIYGFHQTVYSSVGGYTNVVYTTCRPISSANEDGTFVYGDPINGFATRNLNVQTMNTVTAEPLQIVIDYGKPVTFTESEILKCVTYDPLDVQISYKGIRTTGEHGAIVFREPAELFLLEEGEELITDNGLYDRSLDSFRFTPKGMLEEIERLYALVRVDDVYLGGGWYLTVEIRIIPANIMYYEAESLEKAGELSFVEKWTEEVVTEPTESETEENEPAETESTETESTEAESTESESTELESTEEENSEEELPNQTAPEDDGVRINTQITHVLDTEDREHPVTTYDPTYDRNVLFFGFDDPVLNKDRYINTQTPTVYGNVNFDEVVNWWSPGYGAINGISDGVLRFTTTNSDNPWGYVATGKADSTAATTANKASFPLQYIPADDDWCEIRLKVDKTAVQDGSGMHLRIEFFPLSGDTSLAHAAVSTKLFPEGALNNGWFVLKFPLTTIENTENPCDIKYSELSIIRRINFLIRGLDKSETFTTEIDYIYIGPEEHCPSNQKMDYLYFGFDNTAADQYRYTNPIYGYTYNFDKTPSGSGNDWAFTSSRTPNLTVSDGAMVVTCGEAGSEKGNSPWLQTGTADMTKNLNYPTSRAEKAWVRLKFSDMTTDIDPQYDLEEAVARLAFVLNDDATMEDSACWIDFPLSEEQLNSSDYMTLSADISSLMADYEAKRITAVRLSIINAAGQPGKTGTFRIDEIYVGPQLAQDTDDYIAPTETDIPTAPVKETDTPTYDSSVLYFGFGNTAADVTRYNTNPVYTTKNFDTATYWKGTNGRDPSVSNGALHFSAGSGSNSYVVFNSGTSNTDFSHLDYKPGSNDWFEVRIKINNLAALANPNAISFDVELYKNNPQLYKISHTAQIEGGVQANRYYTISFKLPANSGGWANTVSYADIGTVKRFGFNPIGLKTNATYSCSIDYFYVGPEEKLPSKQSSTDRLYFGFDNDRAAQHKYGSAVYGGVNFDDTNGWRINTGRSSYATISGGTATYTLLQYTGDVTKTGNFWTEANKTRNTLVLNFDPRQSEVVRVRMKFNGVTKIDPSAEITMSALFSDGTQNEANAYPVSITIPAADMATDGKWFTYTIPLGETLKNVPNITSLRINLNNICSMDGADTVAFDYIYMGPALDKEPEEYRRDEVYTYGWDSSYVKDGMLSDNEALYLEGRGVPPLNKDKSANYDLAAKYSEVSFTFTGTGFDLIGRTGVQQGTIRAMIYKKVADTDGIKDVFLKAVTVNAKGELELYQIPIVSVQGLEHSTYTVKLWFNDKLAAPQIPALARGNQFFIDGIRIYDPIDVSAEAPTGDTLVALQAYETDREAYQYVKEIRNILLSKDTFDNLDGTLDGAVFIDVNSSSVDPEDGSTGDSSGSNITASIADYNKIGPKNEVYLAPGQAVAFRLAVDSVQPIASLDVGAKTIEASSCGTLSIGFVVGTDTVEGKESFELKTATAQYHAVDAEKIRFMTTDSSKEVYFVIYNDTTEENGETVISVTDVKVAYEAHPDSQPPADSADDTELQKRNTVDVAPVRFFVDGNATRAAEIFVQSLWETPTDDNTDGDDTTGGDTPATDPETGAIAEGIHIYHSLNLTSDISVNYVVPKTELDGYESITMVCTLPVYEGDTLVGTKENLLAPTDRGEYYYFTLTGLTAVHMNDTVEATLSMTKEGVKYTTLTDTYSIAEYAYGQLKKTGAPETLKALCVELLRYGGAAQTYKGYRTDSLADAAMTEEQKALLTDLDAVIFDSYNKVTGEVEGSGVVWAGKALCLDSKVAIRYILDLSEYTGDIGELSMVLTYKDLNGEEKTATLDNPVLYNEELHLYSLDFDGLLAAELRCPVFATVYRKEAPVTGVAQYSASTYGNGKTGLLGDLCKCLMAYSDSARDFFTE